MSHEQSVPAGLTPAFAAEPVPGRAVMPVTFRSVRVVPRLKFGHEFELRCSLEEGYQDMAQVAFESGAMRFVVYPSVRSLREMAVDLIDLADAFERAQAVQS